MVTLLTFCPLWDTKAASMYLTNILNLLNTGNTERFKARLYLLTVPHLRQKTARYWMSWNKNHIKNKLYNVEFCPQSIVRDTVFTLSISDVIASPTLPVTEYSAHIPCVFRIHKGYNKKKKVKAAVWGLLASSFTCFQVVFAHVQ